MNVEGHFPHVSDKERMKPRRFGLAWGGQEGLLRSTLDIGGGIAERFRHGLGLWASHPRIFIPFLCFRGSTAAQHPLGLSPGPCPLPSSVPSPSQGARQTPGGMLTLQHTNWRLG